MFSGSSSSVLGIRRFLHFAHNCDSLCDLMATAVVAPAAHADADLEWLLKSESLADFDMLSLERIYTWSPVFKVRHSKQPERQLVLKTTVKTSERQANLFSWLEALSAAGVAVVCPQPWPGLADVRTVCEPGAEDEQRNWVIYPFYEEDPLYDPNSLQSIVAAGRLLGAMHAFGDGKRFLHVSESWGHWDKWDDGVDESLSDVKERLGLTTDEFSKLQRRVDVAKTEVLRLCDIGAALPRVCASWDFRRTNLVFTKRGPVLIDPDMGAHIPRILDLANTLLLWPMEGNSWTLASERAGQKRAAPRPLSLDEWQGFLSAYAESVVLTEVEREAWPCMLHYVFCLELLWQMSDEDNHLHPRDLALVRSLLEWDYTQYGCV